MAKNKNIFFKLKDLAALGKDAIIGQTVRIRKPARVKIGDHSILDDFTYISCGLTVGRYTHIGASGVIIGGDGHVTIGDFVNIAPGCRIVSASNDFAAGGLVGPTIPPKYASPSVTANIAIGDHVLLGTNTVVLPGTKIPEGVSTGAMTLLSPRTKLKPWTLYAGVPARAVRKRESAKILMAAKQLLADERKS